MNDTHGEILHSPNETSNTPITNDLVYRQRLEDTTGGLISSQSYGNCPPPRGEVGWICPICGRGLAPSTSYCPCTLTRNTTCLNGGVAIKDILDNTIPCHTKMNEYTTTPPKEYLTTATNTSK